MAERDGKSPKPMGRVAPARVRSMAASGAGASAASDPVELVTSVPAEGLLHGAVHVERLAFGWVRPWRALPSQRRALTSCMAWYPGIFRQMAACTAGITLEFETDSSHVAVEVRLDGEPRATRNVLAGVDGDGEPRPHDGLSVDVDGRHRKVTLPISAEGVLDDARGDVLLVDLTRRSRSGTGALQPLPGMGPARHVRVWLPILRGCELGRVCGDGTFIRPIALRDTMLVLGDSLSQGFCADDPAKTWPSLVAPALGLDLVNQGIGAQVFQPTSLMGAEAMGLVPKLVVVALGANYRYGRCNERVVGREISDYLLRVDELWGSAPLVVLTPRVDGRDAVRGSCYERVPELVSAAAARVRTRRVRDGRPPVLVSQLPALPASCLADADGHPTAAGAARIADFVQDELEKLDCRCLAELGEFGRCGACRHRARKGTSPSAGPGDKNVTNNTEGNVTNHTEGNVTGLTDGPGPLIELPFV